MAHPVEAVIVASAGAARTPPSIGVVDSPAEVAAPQIEVVDSPAEVAGSTGRVAGATAERDGFPVLEGMDLALPAAAGVPFQADTGPAGFSAVETVGAVLDTDPAFLPGSIS